MREEIIVSGRANPLIDPHLQIWHWQIPLYLFLGGLAAGILFFAGLFTIMGKEKENRTAVKIAPHVVPWLLVLGLVALLLDLKHQLYFWRLYTTIRLESPMSWGAWVLMLVTPLSFIWSAIHIREILPGWSWRFQILITLEEFFTRNKLAIAWIMAIASIILGVYTGILFSAFNARPLWNTSILGPLFLASGLSAGAAMIMLFSREHHERILFSKIDIGIIAVELFLIIHMFMGFLASTQVQIDAAGLFLGGRWTAPFWIFAVILGMILPVVLEVLELRKFRIPVLIPATLVLFGSLMLRFLIAFAGQESRWLY